MIVANYYKVAILCQLAATEEWCIVPVAQRVMSLYFVIVCKTNHSIHPLKEIRPHLPDFERSTLVCCQVKDMKLDVNT